MTRMNSALCLIRVIGVIRGFFFWEGRLWSFT
jgi:hypothetical protein